MWETAERAGIITANLMWSVFPFALYFAWYSLKQAWSLVYILWRELYILSTLGGKSVVLNSKGCNDLNWNTESLRS